MKYSRKCLVCGKEVISSNNRTFTHPECEDRTPTLPVEIKTAEEILKQFTPFNKSHNPAVVEAMHAYHAQFKPTPTEDKGIEGVKEPNPNELMNANIKGIHLTDKER